MVFKFGQFELDTQKRELRRGGGVRPVEPQVFNLLAFLIENRDRIVSRDELFDAIWHKRVVSDSVLASRINAARRAVDDDGKQQRIIRTLRKSGVRFVAAVADEATGISLKIPQVHRLAYDLSGAPSLGLLPFARVDASAQSRAIAAVLGEETRFSLHSVDWLRVTAAQPSADGSHGLGGMMNLARYVLEGSVRIEADRCVIIARLTDTRTGVCLWSEKHGCDTHQVSTDVPRIAAGIARAVAEQIFAIERIRTRSIPARERSVWDAVVVTLSMINTRRKDSVRDAQALLAALVRSDVKSPAVFSLLSFTATLSVHLGWVSRKSLRERTFDLVGRALAVDDRDPWAHLALGYARLYMDNRPDEALGALQHALRLDPCEQLLAAEGLDDVVVGSGPEAPHLVDLAAAGGEQNDGDVAQIAEPVESLEPVELGHREVEDDEVGRALIEGAERRTSVSRCRDVIACAAQQLFEQ